MFGIVMALATIVGQTIDSVNKVIQNEDGYKRGIERKKNGTDNTNTYFDWRGERRDLTTHEIRKVDFAIVEDYGEDRCIKDKDGNAVRNLTEEDADARKAEALYKGRTVYLYRKHGNGIYNGTEHRDKGGDGWCEGAQFKDIQTGQIYVARTVCICGAHELGPNLPWDAGSVDLYMTLDGKFVREADSVVFKRRRGEIVPSREMIDSYIEKYNKRDKPRPRVDVCGMAKLNDCVYIKELHDYYGNRRAINMDV